MKICVSTFLSRLALPGLMSLILLSPALARANTITTFLVSGTAENISGMTLDSCVYLARCAFSGMFTVDTTTGTVESSGLDITFPGLPTFDTLDMSGPAIIGGWGLVVLSSSDGLGFIFTTPNPSSLVGFTGGLINSGLDGRLDYSIISGSITPAPEPSSLVLLAGGIGLLVFRLKRRFRKKSAIH